jgi:N-acyl-phosphatidylethanolamine-hydrolysing phospholipase D
MKRANDKTGIPSHHDGSRFRNPWPGSEMHGFGDAVKWMLTRSRVPSPPELSGVPSPVQSPSIPQRSDSLSLTWIGHSTFLIQCDGLNVLTDPVWSKRVSPVSFAGPSRLVQPPIALDALPPVDLTLISHDHYDHLDDATVRHLIERFPNMEWVAPLKVAEFLENRGAKHVTELDWWDIASVKGIEIGCTPAKHFSGRYPWNRNATLWSGYALSFKGVRVYFAGDTALMPEFQPIAEKFGPFDVAILPIGAYEPRWFMRAVHMTPEDCVAGFGQLLSGNSGRSCILAGSHWGTFRLTDEPVMEPPHLARASWETAGYPADALWIFRHGETRFLTD